MQHPIFIGILFICFGSLLVTSFCTFIALGHVFWKVNGRYATREEAKELAEHALWINLPFYAIIIGICFVLYG